LSVATYGEREPGYAWVVVAVLFLGLGVASGTQGSFGLLVKPWETEFGWDRGAISLTAAIGFVVYGLTQALAGRWADRIGPRAIFAAGLVILGVGDRRRQLDRGIVASVPRLWRSDVDRPGGGVEPDRGGSHCALVLPTTRSGCGNRRRRGRRRLLRLAPSDGGGPAGRGLAHGLSWLGVGIVLVTVPIVLWLLRDDPRLLPTLVGSPIIAWVSYQVRLGKRPILHP
jgi:hypothetical protein